MAFIDAQARGNFLKAIWAVEFGIRADSWRKGLGWQLWHMTHWVGKNTYIFMKLALGKLQKLWAYLIPANCVPRHTPRKGCLFSLAHFEVATMLVPKPPGTKKPLEVQIVCRAWWHSAGRELVRGTMWHLCRFQHHRVIGLQHCWFCWLSVLAHY
jgi:hypothetical protein